MKTSIKFFPSLEIFQGRSAIKIQILAYESSMTIPELDLIFECSLGSFVVNGKDTGQKNLSGHTDGTGETSVVIVGPDLGGDGQFTVSFRESGRKAGVQPYHLKATAFYTLNFNVISDYAMADGIQTNKVQAILTGTGSSVNLDKRKLNISTTNSASFEKDQVTQTIFIETDSTGNANFELYDTNKTGETVTLTGFLDGSKTAPTIEKIHFQANLDCEASPPSEGNYIRTIFTYSIDNKLYLFRQRQCDHLVTVHELLKEGLQGEQVSTGQKWVNFYDLLFPFTLGEEQYIFGLAKNFINQSENAYKSYWMVAKLDEKGQKTIVDYGYWDCSYDVGFAYKSGESQFIYLHSKDAFNNKYPYVILKILPDGKMVRTPTDKKDWDCFYGATFFFSMEGEDYIYIHTEENKNVFTYYLSKNGKIGKNNFSNVWAYYYYPQYTYTIGDKNYYAGQRFYDNYWFTDYILKGGAPEHPNEHQNQWSTSYQYQIPFSFGEKIYLLRQDQTKSHWYITKLLADADMGNDTDSSDNHKN